MHNEEKLQYKVWARDNQVYGPIALETLMAWVVDGRVLGDTWVFSKEVDAWKPAKSFAVLREALSQRTNEQSLTSALTELGEASENITFEHLRQFDEMAGFSQADLDALISYCKIMYIPAGGTIMQKDSPSNGLYMLLSGEARVCIKAGGKVQTLAEIKAGNFIGEMSIFTQGARSADVIAISDSHLLFVSTESLRQMMVSNTALASLFLFSIGKVLSQRILTSNQKSQASSNAEFLWL
ncbi:MAG: cyclic nucleotide-binding domain-containing protein [Verrucomicrobiota bacterium]|nr:cyclic nucleotide-binding domain-containing protein [Verrucomicrobiota bacterium]MDG1892024.1 cyclic nucleotide-binding domain-containing protein [Verrucomicrobiota bacterium]